MQLALTSINNVVGSDAALNPAVVPTARTDLQGRQRLDIGLGLRYALNAQWRISMEWTLPLYEYVQGPQLNSRHALMLGVQADQ